MDNKNKIVKLGVDLYRGTLGNFSVDEAHETLRNALNDLAGEDFASKNHRAKKRSLEAVFEIVEEVLPILLTEGIKSQFDQFVDVRNVNFGDKNIFMVDDYHLFNVAVTAGGNNNIRRQRLDRTPFSVETDWRNVKFYDELELFLAGRVDWNKMIDKVRRSFEAEIKKDIYNAIVAGYNTLAAPYSFSGAYDRTEFNKLVQHVEAITSRPSMVFGTKLALQKATPAYVSYNMMDQRNNDGFFRVIDGIQMIEIPQAVAPGTDNFAIGDDFLLVVPSAEEKIFKLVMEGQPIIEQTGNNGMYNADNTLEYIYKEKYGVKMVTSTRFGVYKLA